MDIVTQGTDSDEARRNIQPTRKLRPNNDVVAEAARTAAILFKKKRWTWRQRFIPDGADLALEIRRMVDDAIRKDSPWARTGRLRVDRDDDQIIVSVEVATWRVPQPPASPEEARPHIDAARSALRRAG